MIRRAAVSFALGASALLAIPAPTAAAARPWTARPATFGAVMTPDVPITMSDGVVLSADVWRPAGKNGQPAPGRFPTLLIQTPYNKNQQDPHSTYLVERGYVDVVLDVRGTGSSGGVFSTDDANSQRDSKEVVAWSAAQSWSTGRVGLHGGSALAVNQLLTAAAQPPALKAIFPIVPTGDTYRSFFPGGYVTSLFTFALLDAVDGDAPPDYLIEDPARAAAMYQSRPDNVFVAAAYNASVQSGGEYDYDSAYYRAMSTLWMMDRIKTPTFLVGGWYDALSQRDAPMMFSELQKRHVPSKLLMGPWYHTTPGRGLPTQGILTLNELQLRWFDRYVGDMPDPGLDATAPVTIDRVGAGAYETSKSWPVPGLNYTKLALSGSGVLTTGRGTGSADVLPWTPSPGVCTRSTYIGTFGLAPPTPCESDNSINDRLGLTYDLPLTKPLDLTGPMSAHLFVSTSRSDAFVTLHLEDLDPATGASSEITSGWDSLSFRALDPQGTQQVGAAGLLPFHPYTKASVQKITPNRVYDWWIEIRPVAARIAAGHMLRLSITTADAVRFLAPPTRIADSVGSALSVYHDAQHPSSIVVPVSGTSAVAPTRTGGAAVPVAGRPRAANGASGPRLPVTGGQPLVAVLGGVFLALFLVVAHRRQRVAAL